mmetsp:Transcript_8405/g.14142  ORF Transcript_8405/g.14142 Transcript_8405/m.14142 type:complete len:908 (+) Transcript_8405:46-2769(+)
MPFVYAAEERHGRPRRLVQLVFPRLRGRDAKEHERWEWPELHVGVSSIQGFGLFPRQGGMLQWENLERPVVVPYLGKETEVESATQARVLRSVLCGNFDLCCRSELQTPDGYEWVQDGIYVTLISKAELEAMTEPLPLLPPNIETELIQVALKPDYDSRGVFSLDEGDEQVCYLQSDEVRKLLHLPPPVYSLLAAAHAKDEHTDRNLATHLVQFTRKADQHLLVNAHPLFRNSAFIMGNANEPPRGPPSLELVEMAVGLLSQDDPLLVRAGVKQSPHAVALFKQFAYEYPEVCEKSTFFCTKRESYVPTEELTVVYGSSYNRTYSTWGHAGVPLKYRVPGDVYPAGVWSPVEADDKDTSAWASWPLRSPGWFNVDQQPSNRPAFSRDEDGRIVLVPDLPIIVKARKQALDGGYHDQKIAKLDALFLDPTLPPEALQEMPFRVPLHYELVGGLRLDHKDFEWYDKEQTLGHINTVLLSYEAMCAAKASTRDGIRRGAGYDALTDRGAPAELEMSEFQLPQELCDISIAELRAEVKVQELSERRLSGHERERYIIHDEDPGKYLDWDCPWAVPLGSIVWCHMHGFPWWPAEVNPPSVLDHDTARLRDEGHVFVRFFGWNEKRSYIWILPGEVCTWEEGIEKGYEKLKCNKKAHDVKLQRAMKQGRLAHSTRQMPPPPLPPPPWWKTFATRICSDESLKLDEELQFQQQEYASFGSLMRSSRKGWENWLHCCHTWNSATEQAASQTSTVSAPMASAPVAKLTSAFKAKKGGTNNSVEANKGSKASGTKRQSQKLLLQRNELNDANKSYGSSRRTRQSKKPLVQPNEVNDANEANKPIGKIWNQINLHGEKTTLAPAVETASGVVPRKKRKRSGNSPRRDLRSSPRISPSGKSDRDLFNRSLQQNYKKICS